MDALVYWAGMATLTIGGIAVLLALLLGVQWLAWKLFREVRGWPWLLRAIKHYAKVEPPPIPKDYS